MKRIKNDKRAVSTVVAAVIMIAATVGMAFAVWGWSMAQSGVFLGTFASTTAEDQNRILERFIIQNLWNSSDTYKLSVRNTGQIPITFTYTASSGSSYLFISSTPVTPPALHTNNQTATIKPSSSGIIIFTRSLLAPTPSTPWLVKLTSDRGKQVTYLFNPP